MELGLDFDDGDFTEKVREKQTLTSYNARICYPEWFLSEEAENDLTDRATLYKFGGDYHYQHRNCQSAINCYCVSLDNLSVHNRTMRRELVESLARCHMQAGNFQMSAKYTQMVMDDCLTIDNYCQALMLERQLHRLSAHLAGEVRVLHLLVTFHALSSQFWMQLTEVYEKIKDFVLSTSAQNYEEVKDDLHTTSPVPADCATNSRGDLQNDTSTNGVGTDTNNEINLQQGEIITSKTVDKGENSSCISKKNMCIEQITESSSNEESSHMRNVCSSIIDHVGENSSYEESSHMRNVYSKIAHVGENSSCDTSCEQVRENSSCERSACTKNLCSNTEQAEGRTNCMCYCNARGESVAHILEKVEIGTTSDVREGIAGSGMDNSCVKDSGSHVHPDYYREILTGYPVDMILLTCYVRTRLILLGVQGTVGSFVKDRNVQTAEVLCSKIRELSVSDDMLEAVTQFVRRDLYEEDTDYVESKQDLNQDIEVLMERRIPPVEFNNRWFSWTSQDGKTG